jgi:hypothetical protein
VSPPLLARDQHAVRTIVRDDFDRRTPGLAARRLACRKRIDDAHDFRRARILQRNDVDGVVAALVDAFDDAHHAAHVIGAVGND